MPGRPLSWFWMPVLVLALGAGSISMLIGSNWIRERLMAEDIVRVRAVAQVQTDLAICHLWVEEYVSGDAVDLVEIAGRLARAERRVSDILESGALGENRFFLEPRGEERLLTLAGGIRDQVASFAALSDARERGYRAGEDVGIGSAVDVQYDRAFGLLLADLGTLESAFKSRLDLAEARSRTLFRGILFAWIVIVGLAATGLWTHERRRAAAERALEESRAQLLQSQKMEAVGRLAGGIAHDINNYLAAISAQAELVRMKAEEESAVAQKMDAVLATAGRATTLSQRLLAFSRRQPGRPEALDLNHVVRGLERLLNQVIGDDVELSVELAPDLWPTEIDQSQVEQILLNLAVNGREAMPTGGTLTISTRNEKGTPADGVVLSVHDTGSGVAEGIEDKIFEPFFTTKDRAGNSGLGLSTVLGLAEQNGGRVDCVQAATGALFEVWLPRTGRDPRPAVGPAAVEAAAKGAGERVLLVEDSADVRQSTSEILTALGYRVTAVSNAQEALAHRERDRPFDLLLTDVVMPGLSGRQLAERLCERDEDLKVLFVSGYTEDVVLRHGVEVGERDFLQKPYSSQALARKLREILGA